MRTRQPKPPEHGKTCLFGDGPREVLSKPFCGTKRDNISHAGSNDGSNTTSENESLAPCHGRVAIRLAARATTNHHKLSARSRKNGKRSRILRQRRRRCARSIAGRRTKSGKRGANRHQIKPGSRRLRKEAEETERDLGPIRNQEALRFACPGEGREAGWPSICVWRAVRI